LSLLDDIITVMRRNRRKHGDRWRKVRLDRLHRGCFPDVSEEQFLRAIDAGVKAEELVAVLVLDKETGCHVAGVKLAKYLTGPRRGH